MNILITGGTGFIGSRLVARLSSRGHRVRVLTRYTHSNWKNNSVQLLQCDLLSATTQELAKIIDGNDVVYHCAGQIRDTTVMQSLHVDATKKLASVASGKIARWVQLSSVGVYGKRSEGIVTEDSDLKPVGAYEITKTRSDEIVNKAAKRKFEVSFLRPSNVYGAAMPNNSLFRLISMIKSGRFFFIGKPGAIANYIHVDNVVDALICCGLDQRACGQVFNLSDHIFFEKFVEIIAHALGKRLPKARLPELPIRFLARLFERFPKFPLSEARVDALTTRAIYSNEKIERELDYQHPVTMEEGLQELVYFWQNRVAK